MDDTQQSRVSDAAATNVLDRRKRRSSILKVQRPPRAPFSELEFNVATPTDTTKSRRVSFSRRNGVAEFATNEATTTWKNFYEQHNKSLESSGNDSGAKNRPSVGHIGKRLFDEQFQEVDASHFMQDIQPCTSEISINNINYVEETTNKNIEPPNKNCEMSMFTDHSNVFGNDLAVTASGEMTDHITMNFSSMQGIKINDDLEQMEKDLEKQFQAGSSSVVGPAFSNKDVSEYIEFDLNTTHVAGISKDQSDMSITDTIHSPKVQAISTTEVKKSVNNDWIADKENIAVNPYITPRETENFAINEDEDKVLVFDGKRLTIQTEKHSEKQLNNSMSDVHKQRKNIVLNVNDDLPNFVENPFASMSHKSIVFDGDFSNKSIVENIDINKTVHNDFDISMTQCVGSNADLKYSVYGNKSITDGIINNKTDERRKTVVYEDNDGNISITQAVSKNLLLTDSAKAVKRQTIVFETNYGDISVTQIAADDNENVEDDINKDNVINNEKYVEEYKDSNDDINRQEKRNTIVYTEEEGDISITQAVPSVIMPNDETDKRKTIVFDDNDINRQEKRKTIVYTEEEGDISITQAVPNVIMPNDKTNKIKTIVFDDNDINRQEKRKTIVYTEEEADISITQAVPNVIMPNDKTDKIKTILFDDNDINRQEKRKTIVYTEEEGDISITQAVPSAIMPNDKSDKRKTILFDDNDINRQEKRKTIVYTEEEGDISITQAGPSAIMPNDKTDKRKTILFDDNDINRQEKRNTIVYTEEEGEISITQAGPSAIMPNDKTDKRKTIVFDDNSADISMTQAIPTNILKGFNENRKTIIFTEDADISITQAIPANFITENINEDIVPIDKDASISILNAIEDKRNKRKTILFDWSKADISMTQAIPNIVMPGNVNNNADNDAILSNDQTRNEKRKTILFESSNADISMTLAIPNIIMQESKNNDADIHSIHLDEEKPTVKRKTIIFDSSNADISMTKAIPNIFVQEHQNKADSTLTPPNTEQTKRKPSLFDWSTADISIATMPDLIMQDIQINMNSSMNQTNLSNIQTDRDNKRKTVIFEQNKDLSETECSPDNVLTDVKEDISMDSSKNEPKVKNNKVPNIPSWLRSKASEVKETSLMDVTDIYAPDALKADINDFDPEYIVQSKQTENESIIRIPKNTIFVEQRNIENKIQKMLCADSDSISTETISMSSLSDTKVKLAETTDIYAPDALKADINDFDPESIVQSKQTENESIIRIPKNTIFVEQRNIENKIQKMLCADSDSISTGSSNTISQRHSVNEETISMSSLSDAKAKLAETSETSFQPVSDVFYETTEVLNTSSDISSRQDNEIAEHKSIKELEKDISFKAAKPIPSEMLAVQNLIYNKSAIEEILKLKTEVSFEHVPNNKVFVYHSETKQSSNSSKDMETDLNDENKKATENNTEIISNTKAADTSMRLLTNLLDMSNASLEVNQLDKIVSVDINTDESPTKGTAVNSNEDLFFVTRDDEVVTQTDAGNLSRDASRSFKSAEDDSMIGLKVNLDILKKIAEENTNNESNVKNFETIKYKTSNEIQAIEEPTDLIKETMEKIMAHNKEKSYKDANSTKELLEMLSDFTDMEERDNPVEIKSSSPIHFDLTKSESPNSRKDDFINNISAKRMVDVDNSVDTYSVATEDKCTETKTSVVVSTDVVKTLKFDDASFTETDVEKQMSPLRKQAYSDENQLKNKSKVIPHFWDGALDGIKDLMDDLVKPNADSMPYDTSVTKDNKNTPSVSSMEVQANLFTSSQVDLNEQQEIIRYVQTQAIDEDTSSDVSHMKAKSKYLGERVVTFLKEESSEDNSVQSHQILAKAIVSESPKPKPKAPVITFDHRNPLNNILLAPIDKCEVHKYEPMKPVNHESHDSIVEKDEHNSPNKHVTIKDSYSITKNVSQQYVVRYDNRPFLTESEITVQSVATVDSLDQYIDVLVTDVRDTEVNTVIAMKTNTELLQSSSSLTLVDSVMSNIKDKDDMKSRLSNKSPLTLIYKKKEEFDTKSDNVISDVGRNKRVHSSSKCGSNADTPTKPCNKIQKKTTQQVIKTIIGLHNSPIKHYDIDVSPKREAPTKDHSYNSNDLQYIPKTKKAGTSITVQQVITEYNLNSLGNLGQKLIKNLRENLNKSDLKDTNSEASSKVRCVCLNKSVCACDSRLNSMMGQGLAMDWQPDLLNEMSSKNLIAECDSRVNVVAKINTLPFMGTRDCEWESANKDVWTFRLLHGRLRLTVGLAYWPGNSDTYVRADTPIKTIKLTTIKSEKLNAIANLCVRFASEAIRYGISRRCRGAAGQFSEGGDVDEVMGDDELSAKLVSKLSAGCVPGAVRAAAGLSVVAGRWRRALSDARAQLAYSLCGELLTLKVANIPLRSVWEVSMRLQLTGGDASEVPWPRACDVTITPLVAEHKVTQEEINKVIANVRRDWGHAPRTLWKIFRYLKKKNKDDLII